MEKLIKKRSSSLCVGIDICPNNHYHFCESNVCSGSVFCSYHENISSSDPSVSVISINGQPGYLMQLEDNKTLLDSLSVPTSVRTN